MLTILDLVSELADLNQTAAKPPTAVDDTVIIETNSTPDNVSYRNLPHCWLISDAPNLTQQFSHASSQLRYSAESMPESSRFLHKQLIYLTKPASGVH